MTSTLLLGACGSGMKGLTELYLDLGFNIICSDIAFSGYQSAQHPTQNLDRKYFEYENRVRFVSQDLQLLSELNPGKVVYSSAVAWLAKELRHRVNVEIMHRFEAVLELFANKTKVLVSGSHGKSTATAMLAHILEETLGCSYYIGAKSKKHNRYAAYDQTSELAVVEADESDGSFLLAVRTHSLVTNVDREHLDFWLNEKILKLAMVSLRLTSVTFEVGQRFNEFDIRDAENRLKKYKINGFSTEFEFVLSGKRYSAIVPFPGKHFALHAVSAVSVCSHLGIPVDAAISALGSYRGLTRRIDVLKKEPLVISDYAHHPSEIKTVLESVREANESLREKRRLVVFYQPHRISRIMFTLEDHQDIFSGCDKVYILPIYEPVSGANLPCENETKRLGLRLCNQVKYSNVSYLEDFEDQLEHELANPQNTIVILGAGDIDERARRVCT